jgi:AcrR family transcriptional regulator
MTNRAVLELIGVTRDALVETGLDLIEEFGVDRFTLDRICLRYAIKPGSLYKFFAGPDEVQDALTARALAMLIDVHKDVNVDRAGRDALEGHALVERAFGQAHPGLYAIALRAPLGHCAELGLLRRAYANVMKRMLRGYDVPAESVHEVADCLSAVLQGFINAEIAGRGRSAPEFDRNYERLLDMMDASARSASIRTVGGGLRSAAAPERSPRSAGALGAVTVISDSR